MSEIVYIPADQLPRGKAAAEFVGADHPGGARICVINGNAPPGFEVPLHTHPYEEVHVALAGEAVFFDGENERIVRAGEVAVVPPLVPHGFRVVGPENYHELGIHVNPSFQTDWL